MKTRSDALQNGDKICFVKIYLIYIISYSVKNKTFVPKRALWGLIYLVYEKLYPARSLSDIEL